MWIAMEGLTLLLIITAQIVLELAWRSGTKRKQTKPNANSETVRKLSWLTSLCWLPSDSSLRP